jgi:hypothetical protein
LKIINVIEAISTFFAKQHLKASNLTTMIMCHLLQEDLKADRPRGLSTCQAQQEDHPDDEDALTLPDHAGYPPGLIPGDTQLTDTSKAFPTDSAERKRNAKREAKLNGEAIVTVKQNIPVEAHFDDCGENLTSLGNDNTPTMYCESEPEDEQYSNTSSSDAEDGLMQTSFFGSDLRGIPNVPETTQLFPNVQTAHVWLTQQAQGIDILELCGGEGRCSRVAISRKLKSGGNLDLVRSQRHEDSERGF